MDTVATVTLTTADLPAIPAGTAYRISQHVEGGPANPLEDHSQITSGWINGGARRINAEWDADRAHYAPGEGEQETVRPRTVTADDVRRALTGGRHWDSGYAYSPATVARWLRVFHGARGVYAVNYGHTPSVDTSAEAGTITGAAVRWKNGSRLEEEQAGWFRTGEDADGLIWTPADVIADHEASGWTTDPESWAATALTDYAAWCEGEVYGYTVERLEWDETFESWSDDGEVGSCWGYYGDDGDVTDAESGARLGALDYIAGDIAEQASAAARAAEQAEADRLERDAEIRADRAADRNAVWAALESYSELEHVAFDMLERAAAVAVDTLIARGSLADAPAADTTSAEL